MTGVYTPTVGRRSGSRARPISGRKPHKINQLGHRPDVPEHPALPGDDGAGERHGRRRRPAQDERARRAVPRSTGSARARTSCPSSPFRREPAPRSSAISRHTLEERAAVAVARWSCCASSGIADRADELARNLPYGYQRRLEIARALATEPKLLCLDEPAAGFNPAEKEDLLELIRRIRDLGHTVLLIEHDMRLVMGVTDRIVVLEFGQQDRRGQPGRGPATTRRSSPPTWESRRRCCLSSRTSVRQLRPHRGPPRHHVQRGRGRDRHAHRRQRRRQDDHHAGRSRACAWSSEGRIVFDGEDITKLRADQRVRGARPSHPKGAADLPGHDGAREPRHGRLHPQGPTQRMRTRRTSSGSSTSSRGCGSGASRRPARCPAASSRCSRSGGR